MSAMLRYLGGYLLDFLRERVTAEEFAGQPIRRVLVGPGSGKQAWAAIRAMFPQAELRSYGDSTGLWRVRRRRFDVVCISMTGGSLRARVVGFLSGARHILLMPSPEYVYRFGLRAGPVAVYWALADRFVLAPLMLVWLGALAVFAYATGLVQRSIAVAPSPQESWRPRRILVIRLMPTNTFVALLARLKRQFPGVRVDALIASSEGRSEVATAADEVLCPRGKAAREVLQRLRAAGYDTVLLAGGRDYGLTPSYVKAAALARVPPGATRYQWEIGEPLPGRPLRGRLLEAFDAPPSEPDDVSLFGRMILRRRYAHEPRRGPTTVQIGLTKACNYHCLFCPFHSPTAEKHRDADLPRMSYEMFAKLLGNLRSLGTRSIDICGDGEPLMNPEALDMIELARELEFDVTVATNAALLTEARGRRLVDLGVRRMHVSFNAASEEVYTTLHPGAPPGTRRRIITRLEEMAEYAEREGLRPMDVEFSAVLNRLNMNEIPQMVDAAHEARAGWFMLILMGPAEGADELLPRPEDWIFIERDIDRAAARARQYGLRTNLDSIRPGASAEGTRRVYEAIPCYIGHEYALVSANGDVMFCCQCTEPLGNLNSQSFRQIWRSEAYRRARQQAISLPKTREHLPHCECFTACSHVVVNLQIYRRLYGRRGLKATGLES
ncbi:MAG: radical SAM protein [Armatimonadetes bacterium]|nr:radical SAM protein [Armatimonadota bacterium]